MSASTANCARLQNAGKRADAIALDVGIKPGQSNWAFDQFQKRAGTDDQDQPGRFRRGDRAARKAASTSPLYGALIVAWLVASAAAWHGVRQRLREYEF